MKNIFNFQTSDFVQKNRSLIFRVGIMALPMLYLLVTFIKSLGCGQVGGCTLNDFTPVFPFYTVVLLFNGKLEFWSYIVLYLISAAVYLLIFYRLGGWLEKQYSRLSHKPKFALRRI